MIMKSNSIAHCGYFRSSSASPLTAMDILFGKESTPVTQSGQIGVADVRIEIQKYRINTVSHNTNPLTWWSEQAAMYPTLAQLAKQRLCITGTSVPSERLFSAAGNLITAKRSCLSPKNVDMLLFLNRNLK